MVVFHMVLIITAPETKFARNAFARSLQYFSACMSVHDGCNTVTRGHRSRACISIGARKGCKHGWFTDNIGLGKFVAVVGSVSKIRTVILPRSPKHPGAQRIGLPEVNSGQCSET